MNRRPLTGRLLPPGRDSHVTHSTVATGHTWRRLPPTSPMKRLTVLGIGWLLLLAGVDVAAAQSTGMPPLNTVPDWAIYVGLAVVCPEDLNRAVRSRIGALREGED